MDGSGKIAWFHPRGDSALFDRCYTMADGTCPLEVKRVNSFIARRVSAAAALLVLCTAAAFTAGTSTPDQRESSYHGIERLSINAEYADVYVEGGSGNTVQVTIENLNPRQADVQGSGGKLEITVEPNRGRLLFSRSRARIIVRGFSGSELFAEVSSGDMDIHDIRADQVALRSASGNVVADSIAAQVEARASSGNMRLSGITGNVSARTSSGELVLAGIRGTLDAESSSGSLEVNDAEGKVTLGSSSGSIRIIRVAGVLSCRASSGSISGTAVTLKGDSQFHTSSGEIRLQLANRLDSLALNLRSTTGEIQIGSQRARGQMVRSAGSPSLEATAGSGAIRVE